MNTFLVPVDFSGTSQLALEQATLLARLDQGKLVLLHVIEPLGINKTLKSLLFNIQDQEDAFVKEAASKLKAMSDDIAISAGITVETIVEVNKPYKGILSAADKVKPYLIVMGTNGFDELKDVFLGSNASRVISESKYPVLSFRKKPKRKGFKNIILPLDLTEETTQKLKAAIGAAKFFGATIHAISVLMTDEVRIKALLRKQLNEVAQELLEMGIEHKTALIENEDIVNGIFEYAYNDEVKADLIMIMTRQEQHLSDFLIGSKASRVVNTSKIPVYSLAPGKSKK